MQRISENAKMTFFIGMFMIDLGIWVLSESNLRQLVFTKPSLSQYFAYWSVELLGAFACMFLMKYSTKSIIKAMLSLNY